MWLLCRLKACESPVLSGSGQDSGRPTRNFGGAPPFAGKFIYKGTSGVPFTFLLLSCD